MFALDHPGSIARSFGTIPVRAKLLPHLKRRLGRAIRGDQAAMAESVQRAIVELIPNDALHDWFGQQALDERSNLVRLLFG